MRTPAAIQLKLQRYRAELRILLLPEPLDKQAIHRCRVNTKKLRAWLRLLRPAGKVAHSKSAERKLKHLARMLAASRDRQALRDSLQVLARIAADTATKNSCTRLRRHFGRNVMPSCIAVADTLENLRLPDTAAVDHSSLPDGLRESYRKARTLGRVALADTRHPGKLHRFRRQVKYLYYQLSLLYAPKHCPVNVAMLDNLGITLGEIHDLQELLATLQRKPSAPAGPRAASAGVTDTAAVQALARQRINELTEHATADAQAFFAARPKQFMRLLS